MSKIPPNPLEEHLGYWLRCLSNFVSLTFAERLAKLDITVAQWVVLRTLFENNDMTLKQLTAQVGVDKGSLSRMIDRLIEKRLVNREAGNDRRSIGLTLTEAGKRLVPHLKKQADENDEFFFKSLSAHKRKEFLTTIKHLLAANGWDANTRGRDRIE